MRLSLTITTTLLLPPTIMFTTTLAWRALTKVSLGNSNDNNNNNSTLSCGSSCSTSSSAESQWRNLDHIPDNFVFHSNSTTNMNTGFGFFNDSLQAGFLDSTFLQKFQRGVDQGTQFLPKHTPFIIAPSFPKAPHLVIKTEAEE